MVEFVGLGTDNVEVRPKCVFASMLERCIAEFGFFCRFRYLSEQKAAKLKQWSALPVGQPSEVSNPGKAFGQHMLEEPAKELFAS